MKKKNNSLFSFLVVFITFTLNTSLGIVFYSLLADKNESTVAIVILVYIISSSLICVMIDYIRRKYFEQTPLKEILEATKKMACGDFNVDLEIKHNKLNTYDIIKQDLNTLALELSKNEVLKTDFISNVSHEIKTPLAIIKNYTEILMDDNLEKEEAHKYLEILSNNCKRLSNLVTNILKLNKLENGSIVPKFEKFNLTSSITEQIISYTDLIDKKQIELICNLEDDIFINNEESYLEIVWTNLLSNAVKFTDIKGKIEITLKKENKYVYFIIKDNGCGMDSEEGKHIFDKFYQAETSHFKEGNGLGLALVKKVIDILGGKITVESEKNVGTKFCVILEDLYGR